MILGGFQRNSLIDYPGKIASVVFTQGCNLKCFYCHNKSLWGEKGENQIDVEEVFEHLEKRKGVLDGVVITGGEPTLQKDLVSFVKRIKDLGLLVKLDTNGTDPVKLKYLLDQKLVDYIAMDIKASSEKYDKISGVKVSLENIKKSIEIIKTSGVDYEFRTTFCTPELDDQDIDKISELIGECKRYVLQACHLEGVDEMSLGQKLENYRKSFFRVEDCMVR
jgi:pyruvate formate lyase activating enzyme